MLVIFEEEGVGGLEMVTTDEDRVLRGGRTDRDQIAAIRGLAGSEDFICERQVIIQCVHLVLTGVET